MKEKLRSLIQVSKTTFILGIGCFVIPNVQAQNCATILDDFDSNRNIGVYTTPSGGVLTQPTTNPLPNGLNSSAMCAKYIPTTTQFDNIVVQVDKVKNADLIRANQIKLSMLVNSPVLGDIVITLRKKGSNALTYPAGRHTVCTGKIVTTDGWSVVSFIGNDSFAPDASLNGDSIGEFEIQFPYSAGGKTIYFDDLTLSPYNSIDNFDNSRNLSVLSSVGTFSQAYPNSVDIVNSSTLCAAYKKPTGNGTASIVYSTGAFIKPDNLKNGLDKFGILVYSSTANIGVRVSLVNTKVTPNAVHSIYEAKTTQYSKWEFLTLSYVSQPNPNTLASDVDAVVLEFDPGTASTLVYRYDEFYVKKIIPTAPLITGDIRPCIGTATYAYSIPSTSNATYEWSVPSGSNISSGTGTNAIEVLYSSAINTKNIYARYSLPGACTSEWGSKSISSTTSPVIISAGGDATICEGSAFKLTGTIGGSSYGTWSSTGTGTFAPSKNVPNPTYTPSSQDADFGLVTLTYKTVGGNCGQASDAMDATILATPVFLSLTPNTTVCTTATSITLKALSNVGPKVNWYGPSSNFAPSSQPNNGTDVVYTFASFEKTIGNVSQFNVTTDFGYQCGSASATVKVTFGCVVTSLDEPLSTEEIVRIFPNPSIDGHFVINLKEEPEEIIVTDVLGRQERFRTKEFSTSLTGILSVKVATSNNNYSFKLSNLK